MDLTEKIVRCARKLVPTICEDIIDLPIHLALMCFCAVCHHCPSERASRLGFLGERGEGASVPTSCHNHKLNDGNKKTFTTIEQIVGAIAAHPNPKGESTFVHFLI
jgi:hypothetical protein